MAEPAVKQAGETLESVRITLSGHVQGVGFRPFVYRLASRHGVVGQVQNRLGEVDVVASGPAEVLRRFETELVTKAPPLSRPVVTGVERIEARHDEGFLIAASSADADARIFVPPDYFMCDDCRRELQDPRDRRYRYPFINCTQCGPRYTLIESLPYDRHNTSMASFPLCEDCEREYLDPGNRRFHAEPVACPACGPRVSFEVTGTDGALESDAALDAAIAALRDGRIVAVKGIGGYHLMCDANSAAAVAELRRRKQRPDKPLAVMFPITGKDGLDALRRHAILSDAELESLASPVRPIVLVTRRPSSTLADNVAPALREIGAFLPYSPLHQLLLGAFGGPLVATSGNISGEPVLTDSDEAAHRLDAVADAFLHHDRPIVRPADDPVYRRIGGRMRPLRLGRGCAPLELTLPWRQAEPVLAVGGHMKGALALSWDDRVVVSPHIGEMDSPRSLAVFERVAADLQALYGVEAKAVVCDAHSGYTTHQWARRQTVPVETVWHHEAHASAVAAEFARPGQWLMFAWDGVGLGDDGTLWGGEALLGSAGVWRRVCSLRPFRLPGGERAGREPWRSAAALHWECDRRWPDCPDEDGLAEFAWRRELNSPVTSAAGRLFDAAAALICGQTHTSFEAQGPMQLEAMARTPRHPVYLSLSRQRNGVLANNWEPLLEIIADTARSPRERAEIFHASLAQLIVQQACRVRYEHDIDQVGLCGGVFQNRLLAELAIEGLTRRGFDVLLPEQLPCNDASLCYGQAAHVAARSARA
ncbi:MAG: carbamoyltransferase HypF [Gammaproteobacteria bacterium]|nr:carbamoyltransferase HypF [Gammaproteobacteria bacterium]